MLHERINGELTDDEFVAAIRGTCSQSEFVAVISAQANSDPQSLLRIMALLHRLNNRGDIPTDLLRLLESRIARGEPPSANDGLTVDLGEDGRVGAGMAERRRALRRVEVGCVLRDRYEIVQCMGTGGKGTVFKALDRYRSSLPPSQRYVAIKLLHECPEDRDETIEALRRELQSAQTLSHPNIVKVYDVDRDEDVDFFTMELLEGELLSDVMRRFQPQPMPRPHAWSLIRQIAAGLEHAHARNIVHADLKPQNIMVTDSGEVRILDFGSSYRFTREGQAEAPSRGSTSATPAYACCELLDGRSPDPRDDLYALACMAYELLAGAHPFQRRRASEARDFGVVAARPSGLSRRQWRTLAKGLSWHRAGRSISVGDWLKELKPGSADVQPLTAIRDLKPAAAPLGAARSPPFMRPSAVFSVLLSIAAVSVLFVRMAPGGKVSGAALPAAARERTALPAQTGESPGQSSNASGESSNAPGQSSNIPSQSVNAAGQSRQASGNAPAPIATRAVSTESTANGGTLILPSEYQVQPGQHFAEIRVHRPANGNALTWWTEPDSAKPGVDYVSQGKVLQPFPKGQDSMSVFVKLLPRPKRREPEVFYVAVADRGAKHAEIMHTAVRLPSSQASF